MTLKEALRARVFDGVDNNIYRCVRNFTKGTVFLGFSHRAADDIYDKVESRAWQAVCVGIDLMFQNEYTK